jgi:sec-independent protein translocase protein TatA
MGNLFSGPHIWIVLFIILLLFGAPKLPALARSLGQSMKIFKNEVKTEKKVGDVPPVSEADAAEARAAELRAAELRAAELRVEELRSAETSKTSDSSPKP